MPWYVIEIMILVLFVIFGMVYCYFVFKYNTDAAKEFDDMEVRFKKIIREAKLKKVREEKYKDITDG